MRISDEECRSFANSLRYISQNPPEWATSACAIAEVFDADYPLWADSGELFAILAELIDRPTGTATKAEDGYAVCHTCGANFIVSAPAAFRCEEESEADYCPCCGTPLEWGCEDD